MTIHIPDMGPAFAHLPALWRHAFWISYAAWAAIELGIWSRDRARVKGERRDRGSMIAIAVGITLGLVVAFNAAWRGIGRIHAPPELLVGAGIALIWTGIAIRLWAVRTLGRYFRVTVTVQDDHRLIDRGPYRHLSNPSYSGAMVTLFGVGLAMGNTVSLVAMVVFPTMGFAWRIRVEEESLKARFGEEFKAYREKRWALIPFVW
jgi:protein-S-isoprenylcysteine O-methyltransferase Ste14